MGSSNPAARLTAARAQIRASCINARWSSTLHCVGSGDADAPANSSAPEPRSTDSLQQPKHSSHTKPESIGEYSWSVRRSRGEAANNSKDAGLARRRDLTEAPTQPPGSHDGRPPRDWPVNGAATSWWGSTPSRRTDPVGVELPTGSRRERRAAPRHDLVDSARESGPALAGT